MQVHAERRRFFAVDLSLSERGGLDVAFAAALSARALDRVMNDPAELLVAPLSGSGVLLGAFQRTSELASDPGVPIFRRGSGGHAVRAGEGVVYVQLVLAHPSALVACDASRLLNRYVRPVLHGLGRLGKPAHYFGRDVVSVEKRPVAFVGFGHDRASGRSLVEAFVAVEAPFWVVPRSSWRDRTAWTLTEATGKSVQPARVVDALREAFATAYGSAAREVSLASVESAMQAPDDPPWAAVREEAIGIVGAGKDRDGTFRVGGELMASRDAIAALERGALSVDGEGLGALVDETLGGPGSATFGVRSLGCVRDVIAEARG